jgi:hypothetical protein
VADFTNQYAAVLADLEERKNALRSRLESLDATIAGLRALAELSPVGDSEVEEAPVRVPDRMIPAPIPAPMTAPVPNQAVAYQRTPLRPQQAPRYARADEIQQRIPLQGPAAAPERRKATGLNVYVNQNQDWASRQMVSPASPRSVFRQATGHRCPKCGSQDTRVSTTRGLSDLFMFLFEYSIGRCRNCDTRFRIWQAREEDPAEDELPDAAAATE